MGVAALAQSSIATAALGVVLDGDARPMIDRITQPNVRRIAPDDNVGLATPPGDRGDARQGPERLVIAATERPGSLGEQRGEIDPADPRHRLEDLDIAPLAALLGGRRPLAQRGTKFIEFARGVTKLAVDDAQPGNEGANVDAGGLGNTLGHLDGGLA